MSSKTLCAASWVCFLLSAAMIKSPSPLLLFLVPAQAALAIAALLMPGAKRSWLYVTAALLAVNYGFLFKQTFLAGR